MNDIIVEKKANIGVLHLSGEFTIQDSVRLFTVLQESLEDNSLDCIEIDLSSVTNIDVSCLQLLCGAHKTSISSNKNLLVAGTISNELRQAINRAGYLRHKGCFPDNDSNCLLMEACNG